MSAPVRDLNARSHSGSPLMRAVLEGPLLKGKVLDRVHAQFGSYVVVLTVPGTVRMPNGIECARSFKAGERIAIGGGRLVAGRDVVHPGPAWNPRPSVPERHPWPPGPVPVSTEPGPAAVWRDEVLAGYVAGMVLLHGQQTRARRIAEAAAAQSDLVVATMLRHASLGEVPEPVHVLFETCDVGPLLAFGGGTGASWLRGLVSAGYALDVGVLRAVAGAAR
jgi:hypothetical protein